MQKMTEHSEKLVRTSPLKGLRVLELGLFVAAPAATNILAYFGAEVIKVESIQRPDSMRAHSPMRGVQMWWEASSLWNWDNLNKLGITLDLASPEGRDLFLRLIPMSDLVVENFSPRVMENFGLTYEVLSQVNPAIIMVSMPGYGRTGPWREYVSFATAMEHASGICHLTGYPSEPDPYNPAAVSDAFGSMNALVAIFAALEHRRRTGRGQFIEVPLIEAFIASTMGPDVIDFSMNRRMRGHLGNRSPFMSPHGVYPCKGDDSWIAIAVYGDSEWQRFCQALGDPPWSQDEKFATTLGRQRHVDELDRLVAEWTCLQDAMEAMFLLQAQGVAAGVVTQDVRADPHFQARGFFTEMDRPIVGKRRYPNWPIRLSRTPGKHQRPAPLLGQHNREVLSGLLGLSEDAIANLEERKIIGTKPIWA